jgi:suppressor of G2 allele of SKP1
LELKLLKVIPNQNWVSLEPSKGSKIQEAKAVSVPVVQPDTKAKPYASNKNWDKIDQDIKKDLEEEKPEGDGALNALFKQIYDRADENTRRAMMKSYQTSGGTVLSTNWDEVATKDYEGKDRPSAPDGQMWADEVNKK